MGRKENVYENDWKKRIERGGKITKRRYVEIKDSFKRENYQ